LLSASAEQIIIGPTKGAVSFLPVGNRMSCWFRKHLSEAGSGCRLQNSIFNIQSSPIPARAIHTKKACAAIHGTGN
jgi:hypothetical protein